MKELYSIMRDFLEVEYHQESFAYLLKATEFTYGGKKQDEAKWLANSTGCYLKALRKELRAAINRLNSYIAEKAKNQ